VPEGRGLFPNPTARENLVMAARRGRNGRDDWTLERVLEIFSRLKVRLSHCGSRAIGLRPQAPVVAVDDQRGHCGSRVIGQARGDGIATLVVDRDYWRLRAQSDGAALAGYLGP
jgi:branched-chain amino acid transport system ATP-binding protein